MASDSLSRLCFFELSQALEPSASCNERRFKCHLKVDDPIYAMTTVLTRLVCGDASGQLFAYDWEDVASFHRTGQLTPLCKFNAFPTNLSTAPPNEINAVASINSGHVLYAGAVDNAVRLVNVERPDKVFLHTNIRKCRCWWCRD